jgi:hypothetical protein
LEEGGDLVLAEHRRRLFFGVALRTGVALERQEDDEAEQDREPGADEREHPDARSESRKCPPGGASRARMSSISATTKATEPAITTAASQMLKRSERRART